MSGYILRRGGQSLVALMALLVLVFFLSRLTGNPTDLYMPMDASLEQREAFATKHGFNDPLYVQFGNFVANIAKFDFGDSIFQGRPAMTAALEAFPVTLRLALITMVLALGLAVLIGSLAAYRPGGLFDRVASLLTISSASTPDFWLAIVGILIFSVTLGWLPTSGTGTIWHWLLPVGVLLVRPLGLLTQVVRMSMISALASPYVKTARAKGAPKRRVVFVHALRNSMLSVVTVAGDQAAALINGAVVVETVFGWPGIGNLMIGAIKQRDFAVLQACILVTAVAIFLMNILIDFAYSRLDPRIRG
ncbi:ABC transporter permease [Ancylobacter polymorphus]|uniref:ABC transporter permease n=1 Tax=Ancylobacter polymorphus TaxID=223390 RepID=A0A9E6ZWU4_9HYPH|nr:ABC transporter permease [Ancylobacter polymorphus]UOK71866.1 ABC transporter permease [Ancylobacter polymorphus]